MPAFQNLDRLQKTKLILIGIYLIYNLLALFISFRMNLDNLRFLVNISKMIPYMRYIALLGFILFVGLIFVQYLELNRVKKELKKNIQEIHVLKSRLYDIEEKEKLKTNVPNQGHPESK